MEKKFITKEQREKVSNRLVLNFGILLIGALAILYTYGFTLSRYVIQLTDVMEVLSIIFLVAGVVMLVLGIKKFPKIKNYSAIPFAAFIPSVLIGYFHKIPFLSERFPAFSASSVLVLTLILMAVYFIVLAVYTSIYLAKHPVLVEKKKIHHRKKK